MWKIWTILIYISSQSFMLSIVKLTIKNSVSIVQNKLHPSKVKNSHMKKLFEPES